VPSIEVVPPVKVVLTPVEVQTFDVTVSCAESCGAGGVGGSAGSVGSAGSDGSDGGCDG
jgi:hypothetical protein